MSTQPAALVTEHNSDAQMLAFFGEATYGAGDDLTDGILLEVVSEDIKEQRNLIQPPAVARSQNMPRKSHLGNRLIPSTTPRFQLKIPEIGWFLTSMLGSPTAVAGPSIATAVYRQSGAATSLDDATSGGTYTGTQFGMYIVEIDSAGAPDQYKYSSDFGITWSTPADITVGPDTIADGITMTWAATTGHAAGERWYVRAHASNSFVWTAADRTTQPESFALERGWPTIATPRYVPMFGCRATELGIPLAGEWDGAVDVTMLGRQEGTVSGSSQDASPTIYTDEWLGGPTHIIAIEGTESYEIETANIRLTLPSEARRISRRILRNLRYGNIALTADLDVAGIAATIQGYAKNNTAVDLMVEIDDESPTVGTLFMWSPEGIFPPDEATISGDDDTMHSGWQYTCHYDPLNGLFGGVFIVIEQDQLVTIYD